MLSKDLQDKLEAMGRSGSADTVRGGDGLARAAGEEGSARSVPNVRTLEELIRGSAIQTEAGECYRVEKRLDGFWPDAESFVKRYLDAVGRTGSRARPGRVDDTLLALRGKDRGGAVYFDIETCGFSGTPVFLIGAMRVVDGTMVLHQFLARDYGEEAAILSAFAALLADGHTLLSFNGRSFDWPFVTDRAALHRVRLPSLPHVDLLHQARRSFKGIVPDHKLQTLELFLCNRRRTGDISGSAIPQAYHDFVRTGHATQIRDILQHNLLDLVTMAELVTFILAHEFPVRE